MDEHAKAMLIAQGVIEATPDEIKKAQEHCASCLECARRYRNLAQAIASAKEPKKKKKK